MLSTLKWLAAYEVEVFVLSSSCFSSELLVYVGVDSTSDMSDEQNVLARLSSL